MGTRGSNSSGRRATGDGPPAALDALADQARDGDRASEHALFVHLRERFLVVAKRRVAEGDVEDVVQDALRVVATTYRERNAERGILPWSLVVLRNVVGNHYQRTARDSGGESFNEEAHSRSKGTASPTECGLDSIEETEAIERLVEGIGRLENTHPRCGWMFRALLEAASLGGGPREVSKRATERVKREYPELSMGGFHVALHRCRQRLRSVLEDLEGADT